MGKRRRGIDKRGQKIIMIVCLSFLLGVFVGAVAANMMGGSTKAETMSFLNEVGDQTQTVGYGAIFWKYFKYDLVIWLGGWLNMGLFLSGGAFLLRGISLGFASAAVMGAYGGKGFLAALLSVLPQNMILIPGYVFMMCAAVYYLLSWKDGGGKSGLHRERRRKQTEYCILFGISIVLMALGAGIERVFLAI